MEGMNLGQIDLNLLVAFERVLALGSVTRAAKELGITQPAMSRTVQRLRMALGDPLFVKVGRTLVATDRARALQEPLTEALRAVGIGHDVHVVGAAVHAHDRCAQAHVGKPRHDALDVRARAAGDRAPLAGP